MNSGNEFWDQNDSQELEQDASDFDDARPLFSGLSNMQLPGVNVPGITQGAGLLGMSEGKHPAKDTIYGLSSH